MFLLGNSINNDIQYNILFDMKKSKKYTYKFQHIPIENIVVCKPLTMEQLSK